MPVESAVTFDQIRNYLLTHNKGSPKTNLHEHLSNVLALIMTEKPEDPVEVFEELSYFVKKNAYDSTEPKFDHELNNTIYKNQEIIDFLQSLREKLIKVSSGEGGEEGGDGGDQGGEPCGYVTNVQDLFSNLEWAGINFGRETAQLLQMSITKLVQTRQASSARLFGKILGSKKDQWVVELDVKDEGAEQEAGVEEKGGKTSVNRFQQQVANNIMDEWQKLPDCRQKYINIARKIKHIFTGNLDSKVITNPHFPGRECDLLRAQIARIVHSSTIAPGGLFGVDEEDENAVKDIKINKGDDEQVPNIKLDGVMSLENWVHVNARLLNNGRVVHEAIERPENADDDQDEEAEKQKLIDADPYEERLKTIMEDSKFDGLENVYTTKLVNNNQKYNLPPEMGSEVTSQGIYTIKSLRWEGAVTTFSNGAYYNFYIGQGLKSGVNAFQPNEPPSVLKDPKDKSEEYEPNPKHAIIEENVEEEEKKDNEDEDD